MEDEKAVRHILSLFSGLPEEASYQEHACAIMAKPDDEEFVRETTNNCWVLPIERS